MQGSLFGRGLIYHRFMVNPQTLGNTKIRTPRHHSRALMHLNPNPVQKCISTPQTTDTPATCPPATCASVTITKTHERAQQRTITLSSQIFCHFYWEE